MKGNMGGSIGDKISMKEPGCTSRMSLERGRGKQGGDENAEAPGLTADGGNTIAISSRREHDVQRGMRHDTAHCITVRNPTSCVPCEDKEAHSKS